MNVFKNLYPFLFLLPVLFIGCEQVKNVFNKKSPRQKYVEELQKGPLADNSTVKRWIDSGGEVLSDPVAVELPFQTKLVFFKNEINPGAWKFSLSEGRKLKIKIESAHASPQLFIDLFALENAEPAPQASIEDTLFTFTLDEDQTLILRVQPKLLAAGSATLTLTDQPSMEFPVAGADLNDVGGAWGAPREGGERIHKGVDIFAERGTPVLASREGRITQAGNSHDIGGITIWLRTEGQSVYYAHLDSVSTAAGERVQRGDTLGFVGNSGNAKTTPTHLHFGVYKYGAVPPMPFIKPSLSQVEPLAVQPKNFKKWAVVTASEANVRLLPSIEKAAIAALTQGNPVKILGGSGNWYRVELPFGEKGFIHKNLLKAASSPLHSETVKQNDLVYNRADYSSLLFRTDSSITIDIFGSFKNWQLSKYREHWVWVNE